MCINASGRRQILSWKMGSHFDENGHLMQITERSSLADTRFLRGNTLTAKRMSNI